MGLIIYEREIAPLLSRYKRNHCGQLFITRNEKHSEQIVGLRVDCVISYEHTH